MRTRSKRNQGKRIYSESFKYYTNEDDDDTETEQEDIETEEEDASDQIQEKEDDGEYNYSSSSEEEELSDFTEYEETPKNNRKKKKPNPPPTITEELTKQNNSSIIHHRNNHDQKHLLKNKTINKQQINLNESSPINLLTPPSKPAKATSYDEDDVIILSDSSPNTIIDIMSDSSVEHSLIGVDFPPSPPPLIQENISLFETKTDCNEHVRSSSISNSDATLKIAENTELPPPLLEPIEEFHEKVLEDDNISIDFNEILEVIKPVKGRSKVSLAIREVEQLLGDDPSNSEESMEEIDRKILSAFSKMDSSLKPKLLEFLNRLHTNQIVN